MKIENFFKRHPYHLISSKDYVSNDISAIIEKYTKLIENDFLITNDCYTQYKKFFDENGIVVADFDKHFKKYNLPKGWTKHIEFSRFRENLGTNSYLINFVNDKRQTVFQSLILLINHEYEDEETLTISSENSTVNRYSIYLDWPKYPSSGKIDYTKNLFYIFDNDKNEIVKLAHFFNQEMTNNDLYYQNIEIAEQKLSEIYPNWQDYKAYR